MRRLALLLAALSTAAEQVTIGGALRRMKIADRFVGATLDWWPSSKPSPNPGATLPWVNASILNVDLANPALRGAAKALAPFILRIGGSLADQVVYGASCEGEGFVANASAYRSFAYSGGCVEYARVHAALDFCADVGCDVAFGLNFLAGRTPAPGTRERWRGAWDASNAVALLRELRGRADGGPYAFELGNEVDGTAGIAAKLNASETTAGFLELRRAVDALWGDGARPLIFGPDASGFDDDVFMPALLAEDAPFDALTYHMYFLGSGSSAEVPREVVNATYLNELAPRVAGHEAVVAARAPRLPLILGEGGGAWNSGQHGVTDAFAFASGFWWLDYLGTLAVHGHDAVFRQALVGGNYGLLADGTFAARPDLFSSVLWRQLFGDVVLDASTSAGAGGSGRQGDLRTYAACARAAPRLPLPGALGGGASPSRRSTSPRNPSTWRWARPAPLGLAPDRRRRRVRARGLLNGAPLPEALTPETPPVAGVAAPAPSSSPRGPTRSSCSRTRATPPATR
ncbi:glycosyl hydrolase [Aureococcus anophagefferens]|nr:glycosyl hydrolase [Aureococcus anophagefferens]